MGKNTRFASAQSVIPALFGCVLSVVTREYSQSFLGILQVQVCCGILARVYSFISSFGTPGILSSILSHLNLLLFLPRVPASIYSVVSSAFGILRVLASTQSFQRLELLQAPASTQTFQLFLVLQVLTSTQSFIIFCLVQQ